MSNEKSGMTLTEWQEKVGTTAQYSGREKNPKVLQLMYCALGLAGEAGEVADQVKKMYRNEDGFPTKERIEKLKAELGDVGWYWQRAIHELNQLWDEEEITPDTIAEGNLKKLALRNKHGKIRAR